MAMVKIKLILAAVLSFMVANQTLGANLLSNGGFESPGLSSGDYEYLSNDSTFITDWTYSYDGIGEQSYYTKSGHNPGGGIDYAAEGNYFIALDDGDSLATTFPTQSGQTYELFFYANTGTDYLQVNVGNLSTQVNDQSGMLTNLEAYSVGPVYWRSYDMTFLAMSSSSTLTFTNVEQGSQFGTMSFDGVMVEVPEPAPFTLFPFAALAALTRRRKA